MSADIISLESDTQHLDIAPGLGGSVTAWNWKTENGITPLFRPWDGASGDRYTLSCFPLVPWSNRISNGGFEYDGAFYPIHANRTEEHYPIHGDGWLQIWKVAEHESNRIKLSLDSRGFDGNPYHYRSTQTFLLLPDGLQIDLTVTNMGQKSLPFGLGLHPYFFRNSQTRLQFKAEGVWLSDEDLIPRELTTTLPPTWDYNTPNTLEGELIDNCFTGWNGKAVVTHPDRALTLTMVMSDCNGYTLFYRPPQRDFFCLEPITHPIDAFHMPDHPGLAYLVHGDSLALRAKFLVAPLQQV
ncbi:MAG TPA: aldose 1-epimerase [Noviherbaspirillum sp.]